MDTINQGIMVRIEDAGKTALYIAGTMPTALAFAKKQDIPGTRARLERDKEVAGTLFINLKETIQMLDDIVTEKTKQEALFDNE